MDSFRNAQGVHHLYKFRLTTRAGEQRTANIAIAPLLSRDFIAVGRIILVDDITERVSLETQLAQADKLSSIGLLAAGVAHEINTPLAVISSYAQMLSKQLKGDARLSPVLDKITQQSFRAAEIANGLLNFSRERPPLNSARTNLNQVIRDTLSLLEHQFKTAQIEVDLDLTEELPAIHGNPGKLQQGSFSICCSTPKKPCPAAAVCAWPLWPTATLPLWCARLRQRHRSRTSQAHLRSVFHHQDHAQARRSPRHRARPLGFLWNHPGARRQNPRRKRHRLRHNVSS